MNDVKDFGDYSVKNVKSFRGHDGYGFNANLYRGNKKVAFLLDEAHGGEVDIDWLAPIPKNENEYASKEAKDKAWAKYRRIRDEESGLLDAHVKTLPKVKSSFGDGMELTIDAGWFVTELVTEWEKGKELRKYQRQCSTKTLFSTSDQNKGEFFVLKQAFGEKVKTYIETKYGKDVEIFNEIFEQGKIPSVLA